MLDGIARELFERSCRAPLLPPEERRSGPRVERDAIEKLLPHRDPFLFVDRITHVARPTSDRPEGMIVCRYDLGRGAPILAGHFPGRPLWPGVLQVEAVGQAGLCLLHLLEDEHDGVTARDAPLCTLTDVLAGRYMRPVVPDGELEIIAQIVRDGLFVIVVGQCLKEGLVCSAAAVRGIEKEVRV